MAVWIPVIKLALPYVATMATAAIPAFTQRRDASLDAVPVQIEELQRAVAGNAEALQGLAGQLEQALRALDQQTTLATRRGRRAQWLSALAVVVAVASLGVSLSVVLP
ncbi:hypothetical protein [Isoalcanivorax beigongshangi]|uniref:Uncharacterized protein n=1 Tax=Isoalcanivorax beigongshangi TaxID=3238810 RepID=A0ABV4AFM0_9GAMM